MDINNIAAVKVSVLATVGAVGSAIAQAFGGWDTALIVLVICMAVDYITGLVVAGVFKRSPKSGGGALESRAALKGILRKAAELLAVLVAAQADKLLGDSSFLRTAIVLFFVGDEGLSILENIGLMGVPLPRVVKNAFEALRDKGDTGENGGEDDGNT